MVGVFKPSKVVPYDSPAVYPWVGQCVAVVSVYDIGIGSAGDENGLKCVGLEWNQDTLTVRLTVSWNDSHH